MESAALNKPDSTLFLQLRNALTLWADVPDAQWEQLRPIFKVRELPAQSTLLLPGDFTHELLFVCSGLLRFYYLSEEGRESNKAFIAENGFAGPLAASLLQLPVLYGVQTLERSTLLVAEYSGFVQLFDSHPVFERLGRKLAEQLLIHKEVRSRILLQYRATERYHWFISQFPDLSSRIPQYHIASYLGITEVSLSRLKHAQRA